MQALIDFDGWRKWKAYAHAKESEDPAKKAAEEKEQKAKQKAELKAMFARPPPGAKKEERPTVNGIAKKPSLGGKHKSSRSNSSAVGGSEKSTLGSVGEVDESPSR